MFGGTKEKHVGQAPISVAKWNECQEILKAAVVKVQAPKLNKPTQREIGSAFFVKYKITNQTDSCDTFALVTNHHVINFVDREPISDGGYFIKEHLKVTVEPECEANDRAENGKTTGDDDFYQHIYISGSNNLDETLILNPDTITYAFSHNFLDVTLLELDANVAERLRKKGVQFLRLQDDTDTTVSVGETLIIYQRPGGRELSLGFGTVVAKPIPLLCYRIPTEKGSSGSPILNLKGYLVGIHHSAAEGKFNCGTLVAKVLKVLQEDRRIAMEEQYYPLNQNNVVTPEKLSTFLFGQAGITDLIPNTEGTMTLRKIEGHQVYFYHCQNSGLSVKFMHFRHCSLFTFADITQHFCVAPWQEFTQERFRAFWQLATELPRFIDNFASKSRLCLVFVKHGLSGVPRDDDWLYGFGVLAENSTVLLENLKWGLMAENGALNLARSVLYLYGRVFGIDASCFSVDRLQCLRECVQRLRAKEETTFSCSLKEELQLVDDIQAFLQSTQPVWQSATPTTGDVTATQPQRDRSPSPTPERQQKGSLRARLTKPGGVYLGSVGERLLTKLVNDHSDLPRFDKKHGNATLVFNGGIICDFNCPALNLVSSPPNVLTITANEGHIACNGNGSVKYKFGPLHPSFNYNVDAKATDLRMRISTNVEVTNNGHLELAIRECTADIGSLDVHFSGGGVITDIVNMFKGFVGDAIKNELNKQLRQQLEKLVRDRANPELEKLSQRFDLFHGFKINYNFSEAPQLTSDVVDVLFGGSLQYHDETSMPTNPLNLPVSHDSEKFVYFCVADEIVNTLAKLAHDKGLLKYKLSGDFEPELAAYLMTSYNENCIGMQLPALAEKYPNTTVYFELQSDQPPVLCIEQDRAVLKGVIRAVLKAEQPPDPPVLVLSTLLSVDGAATVQLDASRKAVTRLKGRFHLSKLRASDITSDIDDVSEEHFQAVLDAIAPVIERVVSDRCEEGIAIPQIPALELVDTEVRLVPNFVEIASCVKYVGPM